MLIHTTESRLRALRPLACGISPAAAERLRSHGIDPEERAQAVRQAFEFREKRSVALSAASAIPGGRSLALSLAPGDVHLAAILNNAAMLWRNGAFIADEVAPVQLVDHRSDKYLLWGRDDMMTVPQEEIGPNGTAKEVQPTVSTDNYSCVDRALQGWTNVSVAGENPSINLRARTVENVRERQGLGRELRVATKYLTSGNYAAGNSTTLGATRKWNGGSAATPVTDVLTAQEAIPAEVTHVIMSDIIWHTAQIATDLKTILASQLDNQGLLRPMDFGLYFGIPNVLIKKSYYKDTAGTIKRIWSETDMVFAHIASGQDVLTFLRTFRFRDGAGGFTTSTWNDPSRGTRGIEWTRVSYSDDEKVVANDFGYLLGAVKQ